MYNNEDKNTNDDLRGGVQQGVRSIRWPIHPVVMNVMGLSRNETLVLNALLTFQMGRDVSKISRAAGVKRTTALYSLKKLEKRNLVFRTLHKKTYWWRFKRGLDRMIVREKIGVETDHAKRLRDGGGTTPLPMEKCQKS